LQYRTVYGDKVFTCGEDTLRLPLTSELDALFAGVCELAVVAEQQPRAKWVTSTITKRIAIAISYCIW